MLSLLVSILCSKFHDFLFAGGFNATALAKFIQTDGVDWKMAVISPQSKYIIPTAYFGVCHGHIDNLKLESGTATSQVEAWSRLNIGQQVSHYKPNENKVVLNNGVEYTYKALVLAPGFDHSAEHIEGLSEMRKTHEEDNVFVHMLDDKLTVDRNYYHGWNHTFGDMICYSPAGPYKGEGTDFYPLYYESFMRQDKMHGRSGASARIQYWTPNKEIYKFGYANEVALDECHKRGIDVMFGWEMTKVHHDSIGQKIATFKNVDSGEVIEKPFTSACINPPCKTHQTLTDASLVDHTGIRLIDLYSLYTIIQGKVKKLRGKNLRGSVVRTFI